MLWLVEGVIIAKSLCDAVTKQAHDAAHAKMTRRVMDLGWTQDSEKVRLKFYIGLADEVEQGQKARALTFFSKTASHH